MRFQPRPARPAAHRLVQRRSPTCPSRSQPPLHPGTREPIGPDDLAPLFPMALIGQEMTAEPWIDVPGEVLDVLRLWRPTPLVRARRLEAALGTPARIYYKDESVSPAGSHKPNTAVPQAFYNKQDGITRLATETGAGQWGSALSFACSLFDLECKVYMVRSSFEQKPYRRVMIETWGGQVRAVAGRRPVVARARSAAPSATRSRDAASRDDTHYALGSVLNHVLLHQTVIGLEAKEQLALAGEEQPDVVIGSCGGGSNFGGIALPFVPDEGVRLVAVEPSSCPTLTEGGSSTTSATPPGMTPLLAMYTLGHDFMPPAHPRRRPPLPRRRPDRLQPGAVRADGGVAYPQGKVFEAAVQFAGRRGHDPRARDVPRHPGRRRRGAGRPRRRATSG